MEPVILSTTSTARDGVIVARPFECTNMKEKSEYPFTAEQFNQLTEEERGTVLAVAEYLNGGTVGISDEDLSSALNLMKEAEGCVPQEEVDGDPLAPVRRKFAAVYQTALEMAEAELQKQGLKDRQHFNFCLVIEPSYEDSTHVTVVDYDKPNWAIGATGSTRSLIAFFS